MEFRDKKKVCLTEKSVEAESTHDTSPWLSVNSDTLPWLSLNNDTLPWLSVDDDTLMSAAVRLMLLIVVSCIVSTIAFILKKRGGYAEDVMCNIYVSVITLWALLMCFNFRRFMLNGMLKEKPDDIKACFRFGLAVNVFIVLTGAILSWITYWDTAEWLFGILFIGVFNTMAMIMFMFHHSIINSTRFHEAKTKKVEEDRKIILTHKMFEVPRGFQVV